MHDLFVKVNIKDCFFGRAGRLRGSVVTVPLIDEWLYSGAGRFNPYKQPPIPTKWEAEWLLEPVRTL